MQRSSRRRDKVVSASELAQLGYCERKVDFDVAFGPATTTQQRLAQQRGIAAHADFYAEGVLEAGLETGGCFVATLVLGEGAETQALRTFRDQVLCRSRAGRWLIAFYYRASPPICRWLQERPVAVRLIRPLLILMGGLARLAVDRKAATDRSTKVG